MSIIVEFVTGVFVALDGLGAWQSRRTSTAATAVFSVAAVVLAFGGLTRWWWALLVGLVLSGVGRWVYGRLVLGQVRLLHHVVRGLVLVGLAAGWVVVLR